MSILKNKKIYTITMLVVLMFSIALMSKLFIKDIRKVALENNNVAKFDKHLLREGKYSFSLPEGWDVESVDNFDSDIDVKFNNNNSIYGSLDIIDGEIESYYKNITKENDTTKTFNEGPYRWMVITSRDGKYINKYYLRNYSEGKILILKFAYNNNKEKDSIKVVFDTIAMSFR